MATWMARITFPDGRRLYSTYSTVSVSIHDALYSRFTDEGAINDQGQVAHRPEVAGDPLPAFPKRPLSGADDLIPVIVFEDCNRSDWGAVYCPSQNRVVGPVSRMVSTGMQRCLDLVSQNGKLHLRENTPKASLTFCGQNVTGEDVPYQYIEGPGIVFPDPRPADRDLFSEWSDGKVCRQCLLNALLTFDDWVW